MDLLSSKTGQNRKEHHTDLYHGDELIIRRGQTFQVELELNRPFDADTDKLHMDLKTGMERMDGVSVLHQIAECRKIYSGCPKRRLTDTVRKKTSVVVHRLVDLWSEVAGKQGNLKRQITKNESNQSSKSGDILTFMI